MSSWNTSDVIALSSAVIAGCAFAATCWQAWLAHHHNRLSVRPLLVWHVRRLNASGSAHVAYVVRNLGLGPALIRERYFTRNGLRFYAPAMATDEVQAFAQHVFANKLAYRLHRFGLPGVGAAIAPGDEVLVAELEFPSLSADQLPIAIEVGGQLAFYIDYECLYGRKHRLVGGKDWPSPT